MELLKIEQQKLSEKTESQPPRILTCHVGRFVLTDVREKVSHCMTNEVPVRNKILRLNTKETNREPVRIKFLRLNIKYVKMCYLVGAIERYQMRM